MTRRERAAAALLTLGALALTGCATKEPAPVAPDTPEPPSATAEMVGVRLRGLRWGEAARGLPGSRDRFALLLGAHDGAHDGTSPAFVSSNLRLLGDVLEDACHVPASGRRELSGDALDADAVRAALASFVEETRGDEATLLVYLTGLSVVDGEGAVRYLTATARQLLDGRWEGTFTRDELAGWLRDAVAAAAGRGTTLRTVLVTDVARPADSSPNPGVALEPLGGWELHAHRHARTAAAPAGPLPTAFTTAFVQGLRALADEGRAAPVALVHERTAAALEQITAGRQVSELVAPRESGGPPPRLVASRRVACSVRVLDALDDRPVSGARVSLDAVDPVEGDGPLPVAPLPGRHLLRVSAPGYLTRVEEFDVAVAHAGRPLEVRLLPGMVHVQGWVSPPGPVVVTVDGLPDGAVRPGYHVPRARPDADGAFELRLPALGEDVQLVVRRGDQDLLRKALPATPERFLNATGDVVEGLGLVDTGPVLLPDGHPLELLHAARRALVEAGGAGALPVPRAFERPRSLGDPEWLTEEDDDRWELFLTLADRSEWLPALAQLEALAPKMDDDVYVAWRGWLELKFCREIADVARIVARRDALPESRSELRLAIASRALATHLERAAARATAGDPAAIGVLGALPLDLLDEEPGPYRDELSRAVTVRSRGVAATLLLRLAEERRWEPVLDAVAQLGDDGAWGDLTWREMRREALDAALEAELDRALVEGLRQQDWRRADRILNWMTLHGEALSLTGTPALLALAERIHVERVPAEVRSLYALAQEAYLEGEIAEADALYGQLEGRMRGRYEEFVLDQRERLRPQLYVRYLKEGEALELEGRDDEAAAAYARALAYDRRAAGELVRLGIPTPGVLLVTPDGRTGYSEIGLALSRSLPGAVVLVAPGTYAESLTLSGSRSVIGVGGEVEVVATAGSAVTVPAESSVAVSGLSLRTVERGAPTVRVEDGHVVLDSCRVLPGRGGPAVAVGGPSARAELRRCEVPSADGDGFFVAGDARLDLVDCAVGLPGSGVGELRRYVSAETPRHVRVTDCTFGRHAISGSVRLSSADLATIQRRNVVRVVPDRGAWPSWAVDGLTHVATLGEALAVAEAGATVRVAPGVYQENLEPTRDVRVVADRSAGGEVVVDGGTGEFGLQLDADAVVTVEGVTFRLHRPEGDQRSETVAVRRGHLELADCRIEAFDSTDAWRPEGVAVGAALARAEAGARAAVAEATSVVLRRCRISSDALGITIRGGHDVAVWDSEIVGRVAGVRPTQGGRADLVATTIRGGEHGVALVGPDARARLEACVLSGNDEAWAFDEGAGEAQLSVSGTRVH